MALQLLTATLLLTHGFLPAGGSASGNLVQSAAISPGITEALFAPNRSCGLVSLDGSIAQGEWMRECGALLQEPSDCIPASVEGCRLKGKAQRCFDHNDDDMAALE